MPFLRAGDGVCSQAESAVEETRWTLDLPQPCGSGCLYLSELQLAVTALLTGNFVFRVCDLHPHQQLAG